jgi:filamentous hemagglutinin
LAETPLHQEKAREFQAGTQGAFSDVKSKKPGVPALRYDNPNPLGLNYIKLDAFPFEIGSDGSRVLLIDAKTKLATFNEGAKRDVLETLRRLKMALEQNPEFTAVYEVPSEAEAQEARAFFRDQDFDHVVQVRAREP